MNKNASDKEKLVLAKPLRLFARLLFMLLGFILGWLLVEAILPIIDLSDDSQPIILIGKASSAILFAVVGILTGVPIALALTKLYKKLESALIKYSAREILMGIVGLFIGIIMTIAISFLLINPYLNNDAAASIITVILAVLLCFLGAMIGANLLSPVINQPASNIATPSQPAQKTSEYLVDASALIDGRILDIVRCGFVFGKLTVPNFVLKSISVIADSPDMLKKNKGRRGLDILAELQKEGGVEVQILPEDESEGDNDDRLLLLAERHEAAIISVDFNLNKLASVKNVRILNINELAKAIKPITLPGEKMTVKIIKNGKEAGQGVAYLADGTMIVVENGANNIGEEVEITITTAFQTNAGRMIFARIM